MPLQFYDTRRRKKVAFEPLEQGKVKLYTCGPTVYNDAHIGNFRTYMFEDLLRRTLKYLGYEVTQVMNITDIDDKTIRAAKTGGIALEEVTAPIIERFFNDLDALKIERAEVYPHATQHIAEMIDLIGVLLEKGIAYPAEKNIYFSIEKYADYGKLSGMDLEKLERGVRIDADEYEEKESFRDFALWKGWTEDDGDVAWDSPWGRGRPGWHIECSAMSMKYLGETFDIHTGGVDNIFPHHENEIAQSCAATGKEFVRYWLHSAHLQVEGEKMSKSLGNFFTLRELIDKGYSARAIRYVLIGTHYKQRLNFSQESFGAAQASLERLDTLRLAAEKASGSGSARPELTEQIEKWSEAFKDGLENDLNISASLAALFELVSAGNRLATATPFNKVEGEAILTAWREFDKVLGYLFWDDLPGEIVVLIRERNTAKQGKDFAKADAIRAELAEKGYQIKDGKLGVDVTWATGVSSGSAHVSNINQIVVQSIPKETTMTEKERFQALLTSLVRGLSKEISTEDGQWTVKGFIDIYKNVYTISSDTKIVSKILEIHLFPKVLEFAGINGYKLVLADHQNYYPDVTFIKKDDENVKFAVDFKTTYRNPKKPSHCNGMTLGSHGEYFRERSKKKNIQFPYKDYLGHFCLGIIYDRNEKATIDETKVETISRLQSITSVVSKLQFFVVEKWKIASDKGGSGNTANIGSIKNIDDIINGRGMFSKLGESWFDEYWMNFRRIKRKDSSGEEHLITNLSEFVEFKGGDIGKIVKQRNGSKDKES